MQFDRPGTLTVDHDVERAAADLHADYFMRHLERCRHLESPYLLSRWIGPRCFKLKGSASRTGDEPFPVEPRHRPQSETSTISSAAASPC